MPTYDIQGVPVEFPYEAYECQLAYMGSVVRALEAGSNALLESPTGTGKTLCLLCAALGWRRDRERRTAEARTSWEAQSDPNAPAMGATCQRIWYASRTHSQLKQVVHELKRTSYRPHSVVLGSREHFCVHSSVSRHTGARQNAMCKRARDENRCPFYVGLRKGQGNKVNTSCLDIEEIVSSCREASVCPFYKTREDAKEAELLLIPYDYLINPLTRESLSVSIKGSVLIFDEGHNIEKSCESVASFELTGHDIASAIVELDDAFDLLDQGIVGAEALGDMAPEALMSLFNSVKKNLLALEDSIFSEKLEKDLTAGKAMLKAKGSNILSVFGRGSSRGEGITPDDAKRICNIIRKAISVLTFSMESVTSGGMYLDKVQSLLTTMFKPDPAELDKNYMMLLYEDGETRGTKRKSVDFFSSIASTTCTAEKARTLCLWCFSCSVAMNELMQREVHSVIITSGTLSPVEGTADAFGVPFPVLLQNSHVIDTQKQLWGGVLSHGPENVRLDASYEQRDSPNYLQDLGRAVVSFAGCVPDGILLAFQSYAQKDSVIRAWRATGLWEEIAQQKPIFEEPKGNMETQAMLEKYNDALTRNKGPGAILAAVCRGKLCEGIDFTDRQCRLVIMVGIPYPSRNDLRVLMKQAFLDVRLAEGEGRKWYVREAIRAVNQTLGRVIRHRHDFGGVLLCDSRYARDGRLSALSQGLSAWLRPRMSVPNSFAEALAGCRSFFGLATAVSMPTAEAFRQGLPNAPQPELASSGNVKSKASGGRAATAPIGGQNASRPLAAAGVDVGTPLSTLTALWKSRRRHSPDQLQPEDGPVIVISDPAESSSATPSVPSVQSVPSEPLAPQGASIRGPATPQGKPQVAQQPVRDRSATAPLAGSAPKPFNRVAAARATPVASRGVFRPAGNTPQTRQSVATILKAQSTCKEDWLRRAEKLLPRMEYEQVAAAMREAAEAAEVAEGADEGSSDADGKLMAALRRAAEVLLPAFCFDTPEEKRTREALIVDCTKAILPGLLRPLWRRQVDDVLGAQGRTCDFWGRG
mmetsp:Transcript_9477/g.21020  ORF Transcript_9477/g.21020 Transcript_9477/m.21020 type:complete len:1041 (-) Transcript_9477:86-3208(-)